MSENGPSTEPTKVENAAIVDVEEKRGKKKRNRQNRRHRRRPKKATSRSDSVSPSVSSNTSSSNSASASTQKRSPASTSKTSSSEKNAGKKGPQWARGRTIVMTGFQSKGRKGVLNEIDEIVSMYGRLSKKPLLERVGANKQRFRATIEFSSYEAAEDAQGDLNGQATIVAGREFRWRVWFWSGERRGGPNSSNTTTTRRRRMTAREREEEQQSWWWARRKEEMQRRTAAQTTESGDAVSAPPDQ